MTSAIGTADRCYGSVSTLSDFDGGAFCDMSSFFVTPTDTRPDMQSLFIVQSLIFSLLYRYHLINQAHNIYHLDIGTLIPCPINKMHDQ